MKKKISKKVPAKINKTKNQKTEKPVSITMDKGKAVLLFKSSSLGKLGLYLAKAKTAINFTNPKMKITVTSQKGQQQDIEKNEHISISPCDRGYFMTFIEKGKTKDSLVGAVSKDLKKFTVLGKISTAKEKGILVPNCKCDGKYVLYFGKGSIYAAKSKDLKKWEISDVSCLTPRSGHFDHTQLTVLMVCLTEYGILVLYDASYKKNSVQTLQVGGALFSLSDPEKIIWRSESPMWQQSVPAGSDEFYPIGAALYKEKIFLYFVSNVKELMTASIAQPFPSVESKKAFANLKRFDKNPIIVPNKVNEWESEATFNPAALYDDGRVHLLYRAVGKAGLSCLGYASSKDGLHIDETLSEPAYIPRKRFEGVHTDPKSRSDFFKSGYGWGGCEDPKLTAIGDTIYLTYVAYSGCSHPRVALSSIKRSDFLNKKWNWKEPILISEPNVVNKSGCILPEKIEGKYVIFHRVFPNILIDYRDDLNFEDGKWLEAKHKISVRPHMWDSRKLSVGATPIRTEDGWLVIYHAVDDRDDSRYKMGAMLLDLRDPSKVLFRTSNPILEPNEHYENDGKFGVVYPCGAVVVGKKLFVYYGGGDKVVCCATAELSKFVDDLKKDKPVIHTLKKINFGK